MPVARVAVLAMAVVRVAGMGVVRMRHMFRLGR
jgi:hypothetical protein